LAYVGRARAYYRMAGEFVAPREAMPECRKAALQALAIDPSLADAHTVIGLYKLQYEWDWDGARDAFKEALELQPSLAKAHLGYALYLSAMDRGQEALRQLDTVQELDRASLYSDFDHSAVSYMAHDYARTIRDGKAAVAIDPDWWGAHSWLAMAYSIRGEHDNAIKHARRVQDLNNTPNNRAAMGGILAVAGHREEAQAIYEDLKQVESEEGEYICPYELASIPLGLGDVDTTFYEMNRACEKRADCLAWLQVDPRLDEIRDDPRFDDLLVRVGFEPEHRGLRMVDDSEDMESPTSGDRIMLAVLPLENLSNDEEQEYFSDGMTEEMITRLGRLRPELLGVIARTSAMRYKETDKSIDQIGRELGVDFVIEGGVRRSGNSVRINAQLIQVSDQTQIWGESYTRELADVFAIQADVAEAVAEALAVELLPPSDMSRARSRTAGGEAHDAYLLGRHHWAQRTPEALYKAVDYFERAIELDPDYALAYAGLAQTWGALPYYVAGPYNDMHARGEKAAERALALDDAMAEAHMAMGLVRENRYHLRTADEHYQRAVELEPNNVSAHYWYGYTRCMLGHPEEGVAEFRRAIALDPVYAPTRWCFGETLNDLRRYEEAADQLKKAIELQPAYLNAHRDLIWSYLGQEKTDDAIAAFEDYQRLLGHSAEELAEFRHLNTESGLCVAFKNWLASISGDAGTSSLSAWHRAKFYAWCGDKDKAFELLDHAWEQADPSLSSIQYCPSFDNLHDDPRFGTLLARLSGAGKNDSLPPHQ